jgi:hypothetical protein
MVLEKQQEEIENLWSQRYPCAFAQQYAILAVGAKISKSKSAVICRSIAI